MYSHLRHDVPCLMIGSEQGVGFGFSIFGTYAILCIVFGGLETVVEEALGPFNVDVRVMRASRSLDLL
jgi:hypothetical protein